MHSKINGTFLLYTIGILITSNIFMTLAWYGHLKMDEYKWFAKFGLVAVVFISRGIALFEYFFSGSGKQTWIFRQWRTI